MIISSQLIHLFKYVARLFVSASGIIFKNKKGVGTEKDRSAGQTEQNSPGDEEVAISTNKSKMSFMTSFHEQPFFISASSFYLKF